MIDRYGPRPRSAAGKRIGGARGNEYNEAFFSGVPQVIQDFEANLELTYLAQILPGWMMQPIVTYVWHPRGGLSSANALVIGVRSYWHY